MCTFTVNSYVTPARYVLIFSVRQHVCYTALYAVASPSVWLSHGWISQKWLKTGSCNFHHMDTRLMGPMTLVALWLTSSPNSKGNIGSGGAK